MISKMISNFKMSLKLTALNQFSLEWLKKAKTGGRNSKMAGLLKEIISKCSNFVFELVSP